MEIKKTWTELKTLISLKAIPLQYEDEGKNYKAWIMDEGVFYMAFIDKTDTPNTDQLDFENNYKASANKPLKPRTDDYKEIVRAESRPLGLVTCFTGRGDSETNIGDGKEFKWDFSNDDDEVELPTGVSGKRKRIEVTFLDDVYLKEGKLYLYDAKKGAYVDMSIVCPAGMYYLKNDGTPALANEDTVVNRYVINHFIQGDVPMGDNLDTEACSSKIPAGYKFRLEITVPSNDSSSNGHAELEVYRKRTVILE